MHIFHNKYFNFFVSFIFVFSISFFLFPELFSSGEIYIKDINNRFIEKIFKVNFSPLDKIAYDKKIEELANNKINPSKEITEIESKQINLWPVKTIYPNNGAILPFNRIIAYYGNLYSKKMGILGEYEENEMLRRLNNEVEKWKIADIYTPVIPALHYIAIVAQNSPGEDGKYRFRMPDSEIEKVLKMAEKINAIVFLDIQVGFSSLEKELPIFEKYFKMPNVHLGIDPEFSMKNGIRPGKVVGTFDALDINFVSNYLAKIVKENNLPPKVFIVHRYTQKMVTNYQNIKILPEVQIVMHMDGWGEKAKKLNTYKQFIYKEPVLFTGFKLFYKNDLLKENSTLMTPEELLKLNPIPIYIQYQ